MLAYVAVALLAALPYLNGLSGDFVFDDVFVVRDSVVVQRAPVLRALVSPYEPFGQVYRPLTILTFIANARVDRSPIGFHAVNIALHVAISLAVLALARVLFGSLLAAALAAALFAVHPVHTEAVTNIVGRAELLAALAALATLLAFARSLTASGRGRTGWWALSVLTFALGVLAKESALTIVGLVAVVHLWLAPRDRLRRRLAVLVPFVAVAAGYFALRYAVLGSLGAVEPWSRLDNPLASTDTLTRLRTAAIVLWDYLAMLAVPATLSADYSFNQVALATTWSDPRVIAALAVLAVLAGGLAIAWRRAPQLVLAAALFAVPLALTANIVFAIGTIKAERLLYLPSIGWCLAAGWLLAAFATRHRRAAAGLLLAALALYAGRTWARNADWQDELTLYTATVASSPDSAKAHHNYAVALGQAGRLDEAMLHYRRALAIDSEYGAAAFGIGHIYGLRGIDAGALHWYEEALRLDPRLAKAHLRIGLIHRQHGERDAAEAAFAAGLEIEPRNPLLLVNLAAARLGRGDRTGARRALRRLDMVETVDPSVSQLVDSARQEIEVALR